MHLDDGHVEELERVADRVAVVRPRPRVCDHSVRPVERLVDPVDVLALAVRLLALHARAEIARPLIDPRLELVERGAAVLLRIAAAEHVEVDAVEDEDAHRRNLGDQLVEGAADVILRHLRLEGAVVAEQDEPQRPLLVGQQRLPRAVAVNVRWRGTKHVLDRFGRPFLYAIVALALALPARGVGEDEEPFAAPAQESLGI